MSRYSRWAAGTVAVVAVFELVLHLLWPLVDDNDPVPGVEQQLALAAAVGLGALPHVVAAIGRRRNRRLLAVAGSLGVLLTLASALSVVLLVVTIPLLLVPSVFFFVASFDGARPRLPTAVLMLASLALATGAAASFFLTEDPRCTRLIRRDGGEAYENATPCDSSASGLLGGREIGWSGTSDTVALHESSLSLTLSAAVVALCAWGGRPAARAVVDPEPAPGA